MRGKSMKAVYEWVQDLVIYMIFVTMAMNLLPDKKYEKYLRLFAGALFILIMTGPLTRVTGLDAALAGTFEKLSFENDVKTLKEELEDADGQRISRFYEQYRKMMENDIRKTVEETSLECADVSVELKENGTDAGTIRHVMIHVKGNRETAGSDIAEIRRKIGAYYGLEERELEISLERK